jgi:two-component system, NtrC family, C4-dicarboxylate transport response regulator DctD
MRRFEREFVAAALARHDGRIGPTAKALGMQRPNLYRKLRALQLRAPASGPRAHPA